MGHQLRPRLGRQGDGLCVGQDERRGCRRGAGSKLDDGSLGVPVVPAESFDRLLKSSTGCCKDESMAHVTREQVHLAHLARLELTDEETAHYTDQLSAIVEAVERSEVAADDIPDLAPGLHQHSREDPPGLDRADVQAGAPSWEDDRFRVPRILDED